MVSIAPANGSGQFVPPAPKTGTFSGYDWLVWQMQNDRHGMNDYDPRTPRSHILRDHEIFVVLG